MIAALGPNGSVAYYLAIGMVATVNPCGFAMLPAYLSYFMGLDGGSDEAADAGLRRAARVALAVSAGFVVVFAVAGTLVKMSSLPVYEYAPWVSVVIGGGLVVLGVAMLAGYEPTLRWLPTPKGGAQRARTLRAMFVFGMSYAIASIGCTLPTFLVAVSGTIEEETFVNGVAVFGLYALGMALVLTALTVSMALARTSVLRLLRSAQPYIHSISAALVTLAGIYVVYFGVLELRTNRADGPNVPSSDVVDVVTGWSHDVTNLINSIGAVEIAAVVAAALALGLAWTARPRRDQR